MHKMTVLRPAAISLSLLVLAPAYGLGADAPAPAEAKKPKIGIMRFEVSQNVDPAIGKFCHDTLAGKVADSGRFAVGSPEEMDRALGDIAKSQPNLSADEAKKQAVSLLGIQKMCQGSVARVGKRYHLSVTILNPDLTVEQVEKGSAGGEDDLEKCIGEIAEALIAPGRLGLMYLKVGDHGEGIGLPKGVDGDLVLAVLKDGAGWEAGIRDGDVVVGLGNAQVRKDYRITDYVSSRAPGAKVTLDILRPGPNGQFEEIHLSARLRRQKLDGVSWRYSDNVISLLARLGEHGQLEAMSLLGDAYGHGNGVTQDDRLALKWYQKAAAAGDAQAMYNAGLMYESGKGAPRDLKQARDWYQKSADAGNESARERLAELNRAGGQ